MKELLLNVIAIAYGATGIIALAGYWPTIKDLYHHKKPSANILSYVLWTATGGVAFLYAIFILPDFLLRIVSGTNFVACFVVLVLSINLKRPHNR